jgi:phosphatidylglycerophosphate synthase
LQFCSGLGNGVSAVQGRIFGISPAERLDRQSASEGEDLFLADPAAVLGDSAVAWLKAHPGTLLTNAKGRPLAIVVGTADTELGRAALAGSPMGFEVVAAGETGPELFNKKLRRREALFGMAIDEAPIAVVERALFDSVYKGVTDLVTKWLWPTPAFWLTRLLARLGVPPNAVTLVGMTLVFAAAYLFYRSELWAGLACAWAMTFLDTVDGKLARVTATSSRIGDLLDHGTDLIHPPLWWLCLAIGLERRGEVSEGTIWAACSVILVAYVVGRAIEGLFRARCGFNQYIWRPFDSRFRLIVARRNTILALVTAGLILDAPAVGFLAAAVWSVVSVVIQAVRLAQALAARPVTPWLA